jgi:hypothetical protein
MATRTVSAAGGNWNSTATWVGGVIPTTSDNIVADATSGPLTVNVAATIQFFNFTGWTNTLAIDAFRVLTTAGTTTSTLDSTYTYSFVGTGSSQGRIAKGAGAQTYNQIGTNPIPHLSATSASGTWTFGTDIYVVNYRPLSNGNVDGTNMYISGTYIATGSSQRGTLTYHMIGTGELAISTFSYGEIIINTAGTITWFSSGLNLGGNSTVAPVTFRYLAGTINAAGNPILDLSPNTTTTLELGTTYNWQIPIMLNINSTVNFVGACDLDYMLIRTMVNSNRTITFNGSVTTDILSLATNSNQAQGAYSKAGDLTLRLNPADTYTVNSEFNFSGTPFQNLTVNSTTPGTQADLIVNTFNQTVNDFNFTDIDCSGGNTVYGLNLTLSNTSNITQYTLPPSGGGSSESAYTYFS